jgi:hypothetical protein
VEKVRSHEARIFTLIQNLSPGYNAPWPRSALAGLVLEPGKRARCVAGLGVQQLGLMHWKVAFAWQSSRLNIVVMPWIRRLCQLYLCPCNLAF